MYLISVDPGHAAFGDPGAVGQSGLRESDVTLAVGWKLVQKLQSIGYATYSFADSRSGLYMGDRAYIAMQQGAAAHISIHANAAESEQACGFECWYNDASDSSGKSLYLAQYIEQFCAGLTLADRGVKPCSSNTRTQAVTIFQGPAVIVEMAFLSNPAEEQMLGDAGWQEQMAGGIAQAVAATFPLQSFQHNATFVPNSNSAIVDGRTISLPIPVQIINNYTMVPLRPLIEALGGVVTPTAGPGGETIKIDAGW